MIGRECNFYKTNLSISMNLSVYSCIIDKKLNDDTGVYAISFIDSPANDVDFVVLSVENVHLNKDEKKQILTGVVLKPEQLIYRNSSKLGEHYINFYAEQVENIAHKMMKIGITLHNTAHHQIPLVRN